MGFHQPDGCTLFCVYACNQPVIARRRAEQASLNAEEDFFNLDSGSRRHLPFPAFAYKHFKNRHGIKHLVRSVSCSCLQERMHQAKKKKTQDTLFSSLHSCCNRSCVYFLRTLNENVLPSFMGQGVLLSENKVTRKGCHGTCHLWYLLACRNFGRTGVANTDKNSLSEDTFSSSIPPKRFHLR